MLTRRGATIRRGVIVAAGIATGSAAFGQGGQPAAVTVESVRLEPVQQRRLLTGDLRAVHRSRVATQEPGLVVEMPVEEGQHVKAGEVLARLDDARLEVELQRNEADAQSAAALVEERNAMLAWRQRDLELYQTSYERGAANPRELFDAQSAVRIAEAIARQAERGGDVIAAQGDLLRKRLADMTIAAPFDGVVVIKHAEVGEWVGEGAAVAELVSTGQAEAWLDVPQSYYDVVARGTEPISISLGSGRELRSTDRIRVVPMMDPRARTFFVVATLDDPEGSLTPGMSVKAWIPTGETAERLTVHRDAVLRNEAGAYVFVARAAGPNAPAVAMPVPVTELFPWEDRVVIDSAALGAGDPVIVEGNERLFPMMPVIPMEAPPAVHRSAGGPS